MSEEYIPQIFMAAVFERSMLVYDGVLAFDLTGRRDPYEMVDICADIIYEQGTDVVVSAA